MQATIITPDNEVYVVESDDAEKCAKGFAELITQLCRTRKDADSAILAQGMCLAVLIFPGEQIESYSGWKVSVIP